jgi:hypothetical protein
MIVPEAPLKCSTSAAQGFWQFSHPQETIWLTSKSLVGSIPAASTRRPQSTRDLNSGSKRDTHNRRVKRRAKRFRECRLLAAALSFAGKDAPTMMDGLGGG